MTGPRRACRCGLVFDGRGMCPHCDAGCVEMRVEDTPARRHFLSQCPLECVPCRVRDRFCAVCGTDAGSSTASAYHEKACRAREAELEKKKGWRG